MLQRAKTKSTPIYHFVTHEGAEECVVGAHEETFPRDEDAGNDEPVQCLHPDHDIDAVDEGVPLNEEHVEDKAVADGPYDSQDGMETPHCSCWVLSIPSLSFVIIFCC